METVDSAVGMPLSDALEGLASDWRVRAADYLDAQTNGWLTAQPTAGNNVKCAMSCHTSYPYMLAHSALAEDSASGTVNMVRAQIEARIVALAAKTAKPYYGAAGSAKERESFGTESVLNATALAMNEKLSGAEVSAKTKQALEQMWKLQRADGTWDWIEYGLFPWETRNDWAVAMAAITTGSLGLDITQSQAASVTKMKAYVQKRLASTSDPVTLHDRVAFLWAKSAQADIMTDAQALAITDELAATQLADGGFSLGAWRSGRLASTRADSSDGYATAVATLALCKSAPGGAAREDVVRGLKWLATHQAPSGAWPGVSVNSNKALNQEFMTDAATAYATIVITSCVAK